MTVLPVVTRELRVASRRPWTYWGRLVAAGMAMVITAWMLLLEGPWSLAPTGQPLYFAIAIVGFGFGLLSGLLYSADCVSAEKRDGTLGLLFLTDLRGVDVTLGKLTATSLGAFYGLVAVLPLMALPLLKGGIGADDYLRMTLVLVATMFCSLCVGVLASVLTRDVRRSVFLTFLVMLIIVAWGPMLVGLIGWGATQWSLLGRWQQLQAIGWPVQATPFAAFVHSYGSEYTANPTSYWGALGYTALMGVLALAYASWKLPHVWQEGGFSGRLPRFWDLLERVRFGSSEGRLEFRRRVLDEHPAAWLGIRYWIRAWLVWLFLLGTLLAVLIVMRSDQSWWEAETGLFLGLAFNFIAKIWLANEAPRQFSDDRRTGALELLLSTSLSVDDLLEGRWKALEYQFRKPIWVILIVDALCLYWAVGMSRGVSDRSELLWLGLATMVMFLADLWAIGWDGLWSGLSLRGRATTSGVILRILIVPWLIWFFGVTLVAYSGWMSDSGNSAFPLMWTSWLLVGLLNDAFWGFRARTKLRTSFREIAIEKPVQRRWFHRTPKPAARA